MILPTLEIEGESIPVPVLAIAVNFTVIVQSILFILFCVVAVSENALLVNHTVRGCFSDEIDHPDRAENESTGWIMNL
jgi:hypothetical protein